MLLIVMTITFSSSIAFYKEIVEPEFFSVSGMMFVVTIVIWTFSTLYGGKREYLWKTVAWYFLMVMFGLTFARLRLTTFLLPPLVLSCVFLVCLTLTLPMLWYLKKAIEEKDRKYFWKTLLLGTLLLIILDVLYFLDLITFPLFQ